MLDSVVDDIYKFDPRVLKAVQNDQGVYEAAQPTQVNLKLGGPENNPGPMKLMRKKIPHVPKQMQVV